MQGLPFHGPVTAPYNVHVCRYVASYVMEGIRIGASEASPPACNYYTDSWGDQACKIMVYYDYLPTPTVNLVVNWCVLTLAFKLVLAVYSHTF